jgi:uncharacterized protein YggE
MDDKTVNAKSGLSGPTPTSDRPAHGPVTLRRAVAVTAAASLLVGLIVGPIIANNHTQAADPTTAPAEHTITVTGMGDVTVKPDVADVYIGVTVTKPTAKEARDAAATQMTAVVAAIKALGVADKDIATTNVSLNPVYDYSNGSAPRLTGYQFSNTVKVTVRDLTKVPDVIDNSVAAGATTVNGVSFRLDNPKPVEAQARSAAMTDARAKADALASAAGVQIKGVASITETTMSSPVYYAPQLDAVKAAGVSTPIQSGTTDVTISVTVSYLIG